MQEFQMAHPGFGGTQTASDVSTVQAVATTAGEAANGYLQLATSVTPTAVGGTCIVKAVRTEAQNLAEQMALKEAESGAGERIMQGAIKDPAFPEDLWAKMQLTHTTSDGQTITIHYWQNLQTGERIGYKFKN